MSSYYKNFKTLKVIHAGQSNEVILAAPKFQIQGLPQKFIIKKFIQRSTIPQESLIHKELFIKDKRTLAYYGDWFEPPFFYMSIEYCPGGDLNEFIIRQEARNLPYSDILIWSYQLAKSVQLLHDSQICHRDIKLENIFITIEGKLKIGDFGDAKKIENSQEEELGVIQNQKLGFGKVKKENFNCKLIKTSPYRDDIWALGKIILELADGKPCLELFSNKFVVDDDYVGNKVNQLCAPYNFKELLINMLCTSSKKYLSIDKVADFIHQLLIEDDTINCKPSSLLQNLDHNEGEHLNMKEDFEQNTESLKVHYELKSIHPEDLEFECLDENLLINLKKYLASSSLDENSYYTHEDLIENKQSNPHSDVNEECNNSKNEKIFYSSRAIEIIEELKNRSETQKSINPNEKFSNSSIFNEKVSKASVKDCGLANLGQYGHKRSKTEILKKRCSICEENINGSEILNKCGHLFHHYCFAKLYDNTLTKAREKINSIKCIRCQQDIEFEIFCLCWFFSKEAYMNAYLQLFAHIKCICPLCGENSDENMLNEKLKFYSIKCKVCKKKYCSFCGADESHGWKSSWTCKYLKDLKKCKFII